MAFKLAKHILNVLFAVITKAHFFYKIILFEKSFWFSSSKDLFHEYSTVALFYFIQRWFTTHYKFRTLCSYIFIFRDMTKQNTLIYVSNKNAFVLTLTMIYTQEQKFVFSIFFGIPYQHIHKQTPHQQATFQSVKYTFFILLPMVDFKPNALPAHIYHHDILFIVNI